MRQVNNFGVAIPNEQIACIIFDKINKHLTFPLKRTGLIDLLNDIDIQQTEDYIKISSKT